MGKREFSVLVKFISEQERFRQNSHQKGRNMPVVLREVRMCWEEEEEENSR